MFLFLVLVATYGLGLGQSLVCTNNPPLPLVAGQSEASAIHENPFGLKCRALLRFSDAGYPPVSYAFYPDSSCNQEIISFSTPLGAPDGEASIVWECEEQPPSCITAMITNGRRDLMLSPRQNGTVTCLDGAATNEDNECSVAPQASSTMVPSTTSRGSWNSTGNFTHGPTSNTPQPTAVSSVAGRVEAPGSFFLTITQTVTSLITTTMLTS